MKNLFMAYLDAGVLGSVIILVGLLLRPIFRKVPRRILCAVWLLAAIRLLLPFNIESQFSLQPNYEPFMEFIQEQQLPSFTTPDVPTDLEVPDTDLAPELPPQNIPVLPQNPAPAPDMITHSPDWAEILSVVWVLVMSGILTYCIISYIALKRRIRTAVQCEDGVMECEHISGAFLLGYLKPRIYLPMELNEEDREFILAHERIHIQRLDHWWKLVGVLCVAIHWYNPLVWIGFALLCRDIEITCDERVIHFMDLQKRKAYSQALLNSEKRRFSILECPVAFGEVDIKQRIRNVLAYHPYGYWLTAFAIALVVFVAFCFLTSPVTKPEQHINLETPATQTTNPITSKPPVTAPATTNPSSTAPSTTAPPVSQPPETKPPATQPSVTKPPVTVIVWGNDLKARRTFQLTSDGTLTIYGTAEYSGYDTYLWKKHADLITKVVMTEGCTIVLEESFQDLDNLREVYLCESLKTIGANAFSGCDRLQYIRIPANVTTISSGAFSRCLALTKVEFAPNSKLTEIGWYSFSTTALSSFTAPPNLKTIDSYAFQNCWRLETVVLKGTIETIEVDAFINCPRLKHVVLGETLTSATRIFKECGEIETVENYSKFPFKDFL